MLPIAVLIIYSKLSNPDAGTPLVAITKLGYSINTEYRPLVYRLLIGFLVLFCSQDSNGVRTFTSPCESFVESSVAAVHQWSNSGSLLFVLCWPFSISPRYRVWSTKFGWSGTSISQWLFGTSGARRTSSAAECLQHRCRDQSNQLTATFASTEAPSTVISHAPVRLRRWPQ